MIDREGGSRSSGTSSRRETPRRSPRVAERNALKRNPPFDKRIFTVRTIGGKGLKRGKIVTKAATGITDSGAWGGGALDQMALHFLYNPSGINVQHATDNQLLDPNFQHTADQGHYVGPTQSALSWQLLFDRTYETWDRQYKDTAQGKYGVYADVRMAYSMVGLLPPVPKPGFEVIRGPMVWRPVQVYFGGSGSLTYYGVINNMGVTYTHWTERMVPNRCVMDFNMQIYPKPKGVK